MKRLPWLLSTAAFVSMHLVVSMGTVVDPDRFHGTVNRQQQNDRVIRDLPPVGNELDPQDSAEHVI